jgi:hypothetical protein
MKLGSSAGSAFGRRELWESCRHDGHFGAIGCHKSFEIPRADLKLRACRKKVFEAFIAGVPGRLTWMDVGISFEASGCLLGKQTFPPTLWYPVTLSIQHNLAYYQYVLPR